MLKKVFSSILFSLVFFSPSFSESIEKECIEKINGEKVKVVYFKDSDKIKQEWYGEAPIYRKLIEYYKSGDINTFYFVTESEGKISFSSSVYELKSEKKEKTYIMNEGVIYSDSEYDKNSDNPARCVILYENKVRRIQLLEYENNRTGLKKDITVFFNTGDIADTLKFYKENENKLLYSFVGYTKAGVESSSFYCYYEPRIDDYGLLSKLYMYETDKNNKKLNEISTFDYKLSKHKITLQWLFYDEQGVLTVAQSYFEKKLANGKIFMLYDFFDENGDRKEEYAFDKKMKVLYRRNFK